MAPGGRNNSPIGLSPNLDATAWFAMNNPDMPTVLIAFRLQSEFGQTRQRKAIASHFKTVLIAFRLQSEFGLEPTMVGRGSMVNMS